MSNVEQWLRNAMLRPGVVGALMLDTQSGLCLGVTGEAVVGDASIFKWCYDEYKEDILDMEYKGLDVSITVNDKALIAIYKKEKKESSSNEEEGQENAGEGRENVGKRQEQSRENV